MSGVNIVMRRLLAGVRIVMRHFLAGVNIVMRHFLAGVILFPVISSLLTLEQASRKNTLISRRIMIKFILVFRQTAV